MKKYLFIVLLVGVSFSQTQEWIYFNNVPMDCANWWCFPTGVETINRIKPNGEGNEIILEDAIFTDISQDQTKLLLIDSNLHVYNRVTMDTLSIIFENFDIHQARFTNDENTIILSGEGITGKELFSYSILESSTTLIGDSLSNYFNNLEISPDGQKVLYFRESQVQPEGVSGCDLPENTLYLTELDGGTGSYIGEVFYHSTADIGEFQFGIMGPPTGSSATGGDAEDAGFTIEYPSGNSVLGLSTGLAIPAGCGTLTNISRNNNAGGLNNIIILDSNGDTLDFTYYDGYLNTDDYSRNVDVIIEDIESGDTTILATISQLINAGDDYYYSLIYNQPYWSDNGFIYLFFFDNSECMQLFKIHSTNGSITQLTDNPCSSHRPSSILETNETDLERFIYAVYNDSLLIEEYWIYDIGSNESLYLGYFGVLGFNISQPKSQTWSPDHLKVAFNEMSYAQTDDIGDVILAFPEPIRIYDTVSDSIIMLVQLHLNGLNSFLAPSRIVWVEDSIEYNGPVWHVATSGSDSTGSGSINSPFATIQKAVNNASNDDTVFVNSGLYVENIDWSMANNVRLIGTHMDSTIIDGGGLGKVIDNSDETAHPIEISNLTIQNGVSTGKGGGISLKMVGELSLKNMRVDNNHAEKGGGVYIEGEGSASFIPTVVHIENSVISNNSADTYGGGIALSGAIISSIMKNVTVVNNSAIEAGGGIKVGSMGDYAIIVNSIFWNNQPTNVDGMVFPYYSNIDIPNGSNNIFTDPLFVNDSTNFNLLDGSPCIDGGTEFLVVDLSTYMLPGTVPDTVINVSNQSYNGIGPDMGAYESNHNAQQTCTADDGTEGIDLWGECYSIENTTSLGWPPFIPDSVTSFPEELFSFVNLTTLSINYSNISGAIPDQIGSLSNLIRLDLSSNQFSGIIPSEIGNLTNLTSLNLSSNQLSGYIPVEIFGLINLKGEIEFMTGPGGSASIFHQGLNLSDNMLTGSIREEIDNLINLKSLDLSLNQLEGNLPIGLYSLDSLQSLNLSNNLLTGEISEYIGNLLQLEGVSTYAHMSMTQYDAFNLSNNLFSGVIPSEICDLPLDWDNSYMDENQGFSISNNQFCAPFPSCLESFVGTQDTSNCIQMYNQNVDNMPLNYSLSQNHPNPFNPVTSLRYDLPEDGLVNITIYDMMGRIVKTLVNSSQTAGYKSIKWNATSDRNEPVSAGLYLYTIQAGEFRQTKKMVLLK